LVQLAPLSQRKLHEPPEQPFVALAPFRTTKVHEPVRHSSLQAPVAHSHELCMADAHAGSPELPAPELLVAPELDPPELLPPPGSVVLTLQPTSAAATEHVRTIRAMLMKSTLRAGADRPNERG
jgi:hypothetical protein